MSAPQSSAFWAILIGINYYPEHPSLNGCVRDVDNVECLLRDTIDSRRLHVDKITAAAAGEPHPPTYANVAKALEDVEEKAKPGDFVYLHYSGHGGRQKRKDDPDHPQHNSHGGESYEILVLHGNKHLKDYELGRFLDSLANAGVKALAVLDCCHSGGADRARDTTRGLDKILPPDQDDISTPELEHTDGAAQDATRDGSAEASYWVRARKYTLLAACHPHEKASEFPLKGGKQGALTYTMLNSLGKLRANGGIPTYKTLYWDILANIPRVSATQHPMIFGELDLHFLGSDSLQSTRSAVVDQISNGQLRISRGEVHGVRRGEEYAVHPRGAFDLSQVMTKIKIDSVNAVHAFAKMPAVVGVEPGCPVSLVTPVIADRLHVKVQSPELLRALQEIPRSKVEFHAYDFQDATHQVLSGDRFHQIADATGTTLPNCPPFPTGGDAANKICEFLEKLAHYTMIAQLYNKKSGLNGLFVLHERDGLEEVFHEDCVNLEFKNLKSPFVEPSRNVLYFSVLNLRTDWEVALVIPDPYDSYESIAVTPGETSDPYRIRMTIPDSKDAELDDIFKVIVTTEPSRFNSLDTTGDVNRGNDGSGDFHQLEDILPIPEGLERAGNPERRGGDWQTATLRIKTKTRPQT